MAKIRKNKRRNRFQHDKNRKRMKKDRLAKIQCKVVEEKWDHNKSTVKNLRDMGLVFNVNKDIAKVQVEEAKEEVISVVLDTLKREANAPREKGYRIPRNQIEFLTYMLDKYGEDFKAMTRDKRNYAQLTWKQLRTKVNVFKNIPEQYNIFLESRKGKVVDYAAVPKLALDDDDD